jgi:hypothetical protein
MLDDSFVAADHQAIAAVQTPDSAAGSAIDVVDALGLELGGAANVVMIVRVAAIDDDVARLQQRLERSQDRIDHGRGYHEPDSARLSQLLHELPQCGS